MHKKLCKISATPFSFLCYHNAKDDFNENVHFRISLRETLIFFSRTIFRKCRSFRSLNLPLALVKVSFRGKFKSDKKPDGTRISANQHLQYIQREGNFSNIEQSHENLATDKIAAANHLDYINRNNEFAQLEGCIFHSHHLPKWANDNPKYFFQAADKYESCGNRRYMEIEFALPNELTTVEQYRQIIDAFIVKHLSAHYFAYAIHEKIGALSNGQRHPHVHIIFSERIIDDVKN